MAKSIVKGLPNGQPQRSKLFWEVFWRRLSQHKIPNKGQGHASLLAPEASQAPIGLQGTAEDEPALTFRRVSPSDENRLVVAPGYEAKVLMRWGDPLHLDAPRLDELVRLPVGGWRYRIASDFNRRITAETPIEITGPAAGHDWLKVSYDPQGRQVRGTPYSWGTYGLRRGTWPGAGSHVDCFSHGAERCLLLCNSFVTLQSSPIFIIFHGIHS